MKTKLTERQEQILAYIRETVALKQAAPTLTEMAEHFGIRCSTVAYHLKALQKKKRLERTSNARGITLKSMADPCRTRRCMYKIPVRSGVDAPPERTKVFVPEQLHANCPKEQILAVRVDDDSMIGLGIYNGDVVIGIPLEYKRPLPGDIVIAVLKNGETKVRSYFPATIRSFELVTAGINREITLYPYAGNHIRAVVVALTRLY